MANNDKNIMINNKYILKKIKLFMTGFRRGISGLAQG